MSLFNFVMTVFFYGVYFLMCQKVDTEVAALSFSATDLKHFQTALDFAICAPLSLIIGWRFLDKD